MKISFTRHAMPAKGTAVLTVAADGKLGAQGVKLDKKTGGTLTRAMAASKFTSKKNETLVVLAPARTQLNRLILVGIGKPEDVTADTWLTVGGAAAAAAAQGKDAQATLLVDDHKGDKTAAADAAAQAGFGALLRSYRFDKYLTKDKSKPALKALVVATSAPPAAQKSFVSLQAVAESVSYTRDLVSEPGNVMYPETLAQACRNLKQLGIKVDVLDEKQMKKLGMGALLGVAQGSVHAPRLVSMSWLGNPAAKGKTPIAVVGKGVTFDTGGISIKPAANMEDMKWDMAGAGAVIGAMRALAAIKAKVNVVGVVALVENMPSGNAQRPGDIVTSMSGQTIEVLNTDAEGRLILADAVWYAQVHHKATTVVDLATLTGAVIVALGNEYAAVFSNDEILADKLIKAGKNTDEKLWRLPLGDSYDRMINCDAADMKNIGAGGAGSIIGAQFIKRFIKKDVNWAHLDIAGTVWSKADKPAVPKGATGFGVRLLVEYLTKQAT
jgi:leucyl aminopeptidase